MFTALGGLSQIESHCLGKHVTSDLCFVAVASLGFGNRRSEAYATGKASHCAGLAGFFGHYLVVSVIKKSV